MKIYNPDLCKQLLGEQVAKLFDGTIEIEPTKDDLVYGNLKVGDTLTFVLNDSDSKANNVFVVSWKK